MKYIGCLFLLLSLMISGCKSTEGSVKSASKQADFESIASQKFKQSYTKLYNASGTHVACYVIHKKTENSPTEQLHLMLFEVSNNELIYEKTAADAQIKWLTDKRLEISIPARNPELSGSSEVYDVEKRKNVKVSSDL